MCTKNGFGFGSWCLFVIFLVLFPFPQICHTSKIVQAQNTQKMNLDQNFTNLELESKAGAEVKAKSGERTADEGAEDDEDQFNEYLNYIMELYPWPKVSVRAVRKRVENEDGTTGSVPVPLDDDFLLDVTNFTQVLITCTAPYLLSWIAHPELARTLSVIDSFRDARDVFNSSSFFFDSTMVIDVDSETQGETKCGSSDYSEPWTKILLFQEGKKIPQFGQSGHRFRFFNYRLQPTEGIFQIPCPARYPGVEAKLVQIFNEGQGSKKEIQKEISEEYFAKFGFILSPSFADENGVLQGTFQCITTNPEIIENKTDFARVYFSKKPWVGYSLPEEKVTIEFLADDFKPKFRGLDVTVESFGLGYITGGTGARKNASTSLDITGNGTSDFDSDLDLDPEGEPTMGYFIQTGGMECVNLKGTRSRQIFLNVPCSNPLECQVARTCLDTNLCAAKTLRGAPCRSGACLQLPIVHFSGAVLCSSGQAISRNYYFTGLDRVTYWAHDINPHVPRRALISMDEVPSVLYTNQEHYFFCEASAFFFTRKFQFLILMRNGSQSVEMSQVLPGSFRVANPNITKRASRGAISLGVYINVTAEARGIMCLVPWYNSTGWMNMTRTFTAKDVSPPVINEPQKPHQIFYLGEETRILQCSSSGDPPPTLNWIIKWNDTEIYIGAGEKLERPGTGAEFGFGFEVQAKEDGSSILAFPKITKDVAGIYFCRARNEYGNDTFQYTVDVDEPGISAATISAISLLVLVLILSFSIVLRKYMLTKSKLRNLTQSEIEEFRKGNPEKLNQLPEDAALEQFQYLPFNKKYELKESELSIFQDDILGQGNFGKVLSGKLKDVPVAVKTTKVDTDVNVFKEFLKEIKVMTHIGEHENVVKLLGAVTSKIKKRLVYIVVELSPFGSLESHLENNRHAFVAIPNQQSQNLHENQEDGQVKTVITISVSDMIKWCMQIAQGMSHLASKKIIHGDLATRNILLFDNYTAKITDFGLSVHLYDKLYAKQQLAMMPWRSMAIESLRDFKFSTQSDIWAFGVTVWEVFTLAQVPYPGLSRSPQFLDELEAGMRMQKPPLASKEIYDVMLKCWDVNPEQRPSFEELAAIFKTLLTTNSNSNASHFLQPQIGRAENLQEKLATAYVENEIEQVEMKNLPCSNYKADFSNLA